MNEKISDKKKLNPILSILLILSLIIISIIVGCFISDKKAMEEVSIHADNGEWEIVSSTTYYRDGRECIGYRVYVDYDYGKNDVYKNIFSYITDDDGYYLHTMWIYYIKHHADGSHSANYVMEQTSQGQIPEPVKQ